MKSITALQVWYSQLCLIHSQCQLAVDLDNCVTSKMEGISIDSSTAVVQSKL